jgi:hypothetical protein
LSRAPLAIEAVRRIDAIFDAERAINGRPAEARLAVRRQHIALLVTELETWMRESRGKLSRHNPVAKAMDYMLVRWDTFAVGSSASNPQRWQDLLDKQCGRAGAAWHCSRKKVLAVRR